MLEWIWNYKKICEEFYELGVDAITTGNHVWDQREIIQHIEKIKDLSACNFVIRLLEEVMVYQLKEEVRLLL